MTNETKALYILIGICIGWLLGNKTFITTTKIVVREVSDVMRLEKRHA